MECTGLGRTLGRIAALSLLALVAAQPVPAAVALQGPEPSWLDQSNPANWNAPSMAVPIAPPAIGPIEPRFRERGRPPETPEDATLTAAGWDLIAPYQAGWGLKIITAASDYDGMGRPNEYQTFVFVDGVFAGTLSPRLMDSRTDSALFRAEFSGPTTISAQFVRYAATDPLCCPSARTIVDYHIERSSAGPTVAPDSAFTQPSGGD